jgi:hypothetical protein
MNEKRYIKNKAKKVYEVFKPMCTNFWCERDIIAILQEVFEKGKTIKKENK